jgi:ribosomal protein S18 acetylase RimI-like enzyme
MDTLIRLNRSQVELASKVLARAFENGLAYVAYFPDATRRVMQNYHLLKYTVRYCMRYGEVYTTSPNLEGISLWQLRDPEEEQEQHGKLRSVIVNWLNFCLRLRLGKGLERVKSLTKYVFLTHDELMPLRHWYLLGIGVDPKFQGQGFGGNLITPMLARIDREQFECYLDTNNEKNVGLYEHFGFKVVKRYEIFDSDVINWSMVREPPG